MTVTALLHRRVWLPTVILCASVASPAWAQQTTLGQLPEESPTIVQYRLGPFILNPTYSLPEVGFDSNVFNEQSSPREDYVVKLRPQMDLFSDFGIFRLAATSGATFTYYHRYKSERSIAQDVRGRLTARLGRIHPWIGGASVVTNERTVPEIDARIKRIEHEAAAGAQFEVTPVALVNVWANRRHESVGANDVFRGVLLAPEHNHATDTVAASLRIKATPFTTVTLPGYTSRDEFGVAIDRDSSSKGGGVELSFSPEAIIRGSLAIGFRHFDPEDPRLATFRGLTGRGDITAVVRGNALVGAEYLRDVRYSFDRNEGYYVETGGNFMYTQRIGGPFDVQVRYGRQHLGYGVAQQGTEHSDVVTLYQGGVGYALENRSRIGISYEYATRNGDTRPDRTYARRRIFGSFTYEFWK